MKFLPCVQTDRQTDMTEVIVAFRNLMQLIRRDFLFIFCQTQKLSITQVGNFVETRQLGVALNQVDSKQRNKTFIIYFESTTIERELNREKTWLKDKDITILKLQKILVLCYSYYYYYYYYYYSLLCSVFKIMYLVPPVFLWHLMLQLFCI